MARPMNPASSKFARPTSTTDSEQSPKRVSRFTKKMIQFAGTFDGGWDVDLEGSVDGVTWHPIQAGITTPTLVDPESDPTVDLQWTWMRVTADVVGTQSDAALTITMAALSE